MKKIVFLIVLFALGFTSLQAHLEPAPSRKFTKDVGDQFIQVQVLNFVGDFEPEGLKVENSLPLTNMVDISYFYRMAPKLDVGALVGFASYNAKLSYYSYDYTYYFLAARGFYNLLDGPNLDVRAGMTLGYRIASAKLDGDVATPSSPQSGGVAWGVHLNTRYFFTENLGASIELGYGMRAVSLGLAYKL